MGILVTQISLKYVMENKEIYMGNFINNAPFALVLVFPDYWICAAD